jgi:endoglucanase
MRNLSVSKLTLASVVAVASLGAVAALSCCPPPKRSAHSASDQSGSAAGQPVRGDQVPVNKYIVVDQFGYRPDMKKVAVLVDPIEGWNAGDSFAPGENYEVRRMADARVVYAGKTTPWKNGEEQKNAGDRGFWFDFSPLKEPGSYFVYDTKNGVRSYQFEIKNDVYRDVLKAATRMYYFNRCNFAKVAPFACVGQKCWLQGLDYMGPGQDGEARSIKEQDKAKTARDLSGGWWDAGDTDKYVTFALDAVHQLLTAYEEHPSPFTDDYNIPESGNGIPDLIDELKYEFDWLKRTQPADLKGAVIIKMGNKDYGDPVPDQSKLGRFYYPGGCSSATISAASMFAHGSLVFRRFDKLKDYSTDLKERAIKAWDHYHSNPRQAECDDGTIKSGDADRDLKTQDQFEVVAAVYLYALTGDAKYHDVIKKGYANTRAFADERWSVYDQAQGDALLYYVVQKNADPAVKDAIVKQKTGQVKTLDFYGMRPELDLYRAYMREESYHWGSNNQRSSYGNTNWDLIQYRLVPAAEGASYRDRAAGMLNSFHGVNPMQLVYLTSMSAYGAESSANEIYHAWFRDGDPKWDSAKDSQFGPAPGFIPGGPNHEYCDHDDPKEHKCATSRLRQQPRQKSYLDFNTAWDPKQEHDKSWAITEPGIYYQASYVRLVSKFVE